MSKVNLLRTGNVLEKILKSFGGMPGKLLTVVFRSFMSMLATIPGLKYGKLIGLEYRIDKALRRKQFDHAKCLANELLEIAREYPDDWSCGNAIHKGHLALGWVSLHEGEIEAANRQLLEAGKTLGSPQLKSFGPNMALAAELLRRGEKNSVLEYLSLCREFWEMGVEHLDYWQRQIQSGLEPDFGPNLRY